MGGHISARTVTDPNYRGDYTAAMPMCGVVGGGVDLFSYFLEWGLLANYYAGLNYNVPFDNAQLADFQSTIFGLRTMAMAHWDTCRRWGTLIMGPQRC